MNYNYIIEPISNQKIKITTKLGKSIIYNYIQKAGYIKAPKLKYGEVAKLTKKWLKNKPKLKNERKHVLTRCGAKCFLIMRQLF